MVDSACTNRLPSLNFTFTLALFVRVNLTFDLLASNLVHIITRQVGNLPTNFGVSRTFRSRLIGQHLSDASLWPCDLDLWPWRSLRLSLTRVFVLRLCTKLDARRPSRSEDDALPVSALFSLVTLAFDIWPWNWCALLPVGWTTFPSILVFLGRFVLDVSATPVRRVTWPCDLELWPWRSRCRRSRKTRIIDNDKQCLSIMRVFLLRLYIKFEVRRPPRSEYIAHYCVSINRLVTLTFDLFTSKYVHGLLVWCTSILPILGFFKFSS